MNDMDKKNRVIIALLRYIDSIAINEEERLLAHSEIRKVILDIPLTKFIVIYHRTMNPPNLLDGRAILNKLFTWSITSIGKAFWSNLYNRGNDEIHFP